MIAIAFSVLLLVTFQSSSSCDWLEREAPLHVSSFAQDYSCSADSLGELVCARSGGEGFRLKLELESDFCAQKIYIVQHESELVVLYEYTDYLSGGSSAVWVSETGVLLHEMGLGSFNMGEPLQEGSSLYVTTHGLIGRLDLENRGWRWHHSGLYQAFKLGNNFHRPQRQGEFIEFRYTHSSSPEGDPGPIYVDPETGEIVGGYSGSDGTYGAPDHE